MISSDVKFQHSPTTCTFDNVLFHTTTNSYNLPCVRQLAHSSRRLNTSPSTPFHRGFDFWFRCGVPLFSLYELDIWRNQLLLVGLMMVKLELFLSHACLTVFKDYDKVKHFNYITYQNTYTVVFIERTFFIHNQELFHFLFQMNDCAALQEVGWASPRLELWVPNSLCPPHRRVAWVFHWSSHFQALQRYWGKGVSFPGLKTASTSYWGFAQWNSTSSRSNIIDIDRSDIIGE